MNDKNLIPFSERTEEELREMRKNGGKKSGETRRRKRDLKNTMKALLEMPVADNNLWNSLSQMGVSPENINNHTAIAVALMRSAMTESTARLITRGDLLRTARCVRTS